MIQKLTRLKVADNTGAREAMCINVFGGYKKKYAKLGQIITVVVKNAAPHGMVKKSEILRAVVVRQKKEYGRKDGTYIRFDDNACVIIDKENLEPRGTRIFGPVARELKSRGFPKIVSLAPEVL